MAIKREGGARGRFFEKDIVLKGCLTVCAPLSYQF